MVDYARFRQRLDAVLRTLDVQQVQDFLIAEGQWSPGQPADPQFAMWMMIAGTPTLSDLHGRAREWLMSHGHEEEAKALVEREKKGGGKQGRGGTGSHSSKNKKSVNSNKSASRPRKKQT
jgi:hypothetical protein